MQHIPSQLTRVTLFNKDTPNTKKSKRKNGIKLALSVLVSRLGRFAVILSLFVLATEPQASIISYWRFEEGVADLTASGANSVLDSSANSRHGTPQGGLTYRSNVPANIIPASGVANAHSLDFDGTAGTKVFIADDPLFQLTHTLTIEAYVNPSGGPPPGIQWQILFRGDSRPGLDPYSLDIWDNKIRFIVNDEVFGGASAESPLPDTNQWLHIAGTLDGDSGQIRLFVDGVMVASQFTSVRPFAELDQLQNPGIAIGNYQDSHFGPFNGLIDEVRLSSDTLAPHQFLNASTHAVPEPSSFVLLTISMFGFLRLIGKNGSSGILVARFVLVSGRVCRSRRGFGFCSGRKCESLARRI